MIGMSHDKSHDLRLCKETSCSKLNPKFHPVLSCSSILGAPKRDARGNWFSEFPNGCSVFLLSQHLLNIFFPFLVDDIHTFHNSWLFLLTQHNIQFSTTIWIDFKISWSVFDFKVSLSWHLSQLSEKWTNENKKEKFINREWMRQVRKANYFTFIQSN